MINSSSIVSHWIICKYVVQMRTTGYVGNATYEYPMVQIILIANWQYLDGKLYTSTVDFDEIRN